MLTHFGGRAAWTRIAAALAALSIAGCAAPRAEAARRPALWAISDSDTKIYLFGTFHLLPAGHPWRSGKIDSALARSGELVTEIGVADDTSEAAQAIVALGMARGLPPLIERVPVDRRDELRQIVSESGIPVAALDRLETWAAALSLMGVMFKRLGLSGEAGVETGLTLDYKRAGKPIRGLETVAEQIGFFDTLSEDAQRTFLVGLLEDPEEMRQQFARMLDAWSVGDVEGIAATFNEDVNLSGELRELLLRRRNAKWADWLAHRLDRPGTIFVAVGAGHLAGPDSVQAMLKARGLKARRLQ